MRHAAFGILVKMKVFKKQTHIENNIFFSIYVFLRLTLVPEKKISLRKKLTLN